MTTPHETLVEAFLDGDVPRPGSRLSVHALENYRAVVGYGWAVYATTLPASDEFDYALFGDGHASDGTDVGWAGYSGTTTKHIQLIKSALEDRNAAFVVVDYCLERDELAAIHATGDEPTPEVLVDEHRTETSDYTGYYYQKE